MHGKKTILFFLLCIVNVVIIYKIFDGKSGLPVYNDLREKIEHIQGKIDALDVKNRQMSAEIRILKKDDKYVQRLIKRELFYVADNELMYIMK